MPSHLLDALVASVKVGEQQLSDALAPEARHDPDVSLTGDDRAKE